MKDTIRISLLTLIIFCAGLGIGILTQNIRPIPPPPFPPLGEMKDFGQDRRGPFRGGPPQVKPAEIEAEMARLRPKVEAYENKLREIDDTFRQNFEAILTPEQKKALADKDEPAADSPPSSSGPPPRMAKPLSGMAFFIIITPAVEHFTRELSLTPEQSAKLRELMVTRRQQFLDFIDATPPPSLELGHMAPR